MQGVAGESHNSMNNTDRLRRNLIRVSITLALIGAAGVSIETAIRTGLVGLAVENQGAIVVALWLGWAWLLIQYLAAARQDSIRIRNRLRDDAITKDVRLQPVRDPDHLKTFMDRSSQQISRDQEFVEVVCARAGIPRRKIRYIVQYMFKSEVETSAKFTAVNWATVELSKYENLVGQIWNVGMGVFFDLEAGEIWGPILISAIPVFVWILPVWSSVAGS